MIHSESQGMHMTDRIRTTISIDAEVYDVFKRMADAAGMSVSRTMGDWLADTAEGAQFVALKMAEARSAPMTVMRELHAFSSGTGEMIQAEMQRMRKAALASPAPSSNTGRNSPKKRVSGGGKS